MPENARVEKCGASEELQRQLLDIVDHFVRETHPYRKALRRPGLGTRLDRDLGLDSMARVELLLRIEKAFNVDLPEMALSSETPAALLDALVVAHGRATGTVSAPVPISEATQVDGLPDAANTLNSALDWHLARHPERLHLLLYSGNVEPQRLSYADLERGAQAVSLGLRERGVCAGDSIALMLPTGQDYFFAFFGILRHGAVPVPIYPPARPSQLEDHLRRHGRMLSNAKAGMLVTVPEARNVARLLLAEAPHLSAIVTVAELSSTGAREGSAVVPKSGDLALLQYTSGSTGDPKGVMLTHGQLLANIRAMGERLDATSRDVFVSWLPLYHDMGLIAAWLGSLYFAAPLVLMSPLGFLARPLSWLELIHRHRGTISGGPNFGYELCLRSLTPERIQGLDLSSWRVAFNGAEPVSPVTLERFADNLAPYGLQRNALSPVYGLAEAAVGLCIPPPGRGPILDCVSRDIFTATGRAEPVHAGESSLTFVNCGPPLPGFDIRVVDSTGREMPERREGDIEFRGPSATSGYFNNPTATRELCHGEWLRTGDRGYLVGGGIHLSGRVKDVIVRGGRNVYPYELEEAIGQIEGVRKGCVAVFGNPDPATGIEALVVVAETRVEDAAERNRIIRAIRDAAVDIVNIPADDVRLVPPHSVLKTSSGKIRRSAIRELYGGGRLGEARSAVWQQTVRLAAQATMIRSRLSVRRFAERLYAAYAWTVFGFAALFVWVVVLPLPRRHWRWRGAGMAVRVAAFLAGVRIESVGLDNVPHREQCIMVANHASYVDVLVLTAALPRGFCHLAKSELKGHFLARVLLQRMGALFVERFDVHQVIDDTQRVYDAIDAGDSVAFFPEGSFGRGAGLGAFHMGAFVVAARCGLPVIPIALHGTRSLLRGSEWFPRPGRVRMVVGTPLRPGSSDWGEAVRLRDAARAFILTECGESDLTLV